MMSDSEPPSPRDRAEFIESLELTNDNEEVLAENKARNDELSGAIIPHEKTLRAFYPQLAQYLEAQFEEIGANHARYGGHCALLVWWRYSTSSMSL